MLTTRLLSRTIALAMTASVTLLAGCPTANVVAPVTSATPSDATSATPTTAPSTSVAPTTAPTATVVPTVGPSGTTPSTSATPVATVSTQPNTNIGSSLQTDISSVATFNGKVYDPSTVPVEGATVNAKSIDAGVTWTGEAQLTTGGAFVFRNAPVGTRLLITVTKDGWTTRSRSEVLKSNLNGDPSANVFNFGGTGLDVIYAIQDEPEVTMLKINGREVTSAAAGDSLNLASASPFKPTKPTSDQLSEISGAIPTTVGYLPSLTGVATDNLAVEMTFSEPVRRDDIQNNFRVLSQSTFSSTTNPKSTSNVGGTVESFTIDQTYSNVTFDWSNDDKMVTVKTNKAILANRDNREARYMVDFAQGSFRDKSDKRAREMKQFRFSPSQVNDYAVFSAKNDEVSPKLLSITAKDGGSSNDILELRFSEAMDVMVKPSYAALLADPANKSDTARQLWSRRANASGTNNATLLGYNGAYDAGNNLTANKFFASYMIARIEAANNVLSQLKPLGGQTTSTTAAGPVNNTDNTVRSAKIVGNTVVIELSPNAFGVQDRILVSAGSDIGGQYNQSTTSTNVSLNVSVDGSFQYANFIDPAGRSIDTGEETTVANFTVANDQKVTTAQ